MYSNYITFYLNFHQQTETVFCFNVTNQIMFAWMLERVNNPLCLFSMQFLCLKITIHEFIMGKFARRTSENQAVQALK